MRNSGHLCLTEDVYSFLRERLFTLEAENAELKKCGFCDTERDHETCLCPKLSDKLKELSIKTAKLSEKSREVASLNTECGRLRRELQKVIARQSVPDEKENTTMPDPAHGANPKPPETEGARIGETGNAKLDAMYGAKNIAPSKCADRSCACRGTEPWKCPHCGSSKGTWFDRSFDPGPFTRCEDCGYDVDELPAKKEAKGGSEEEDRHKRVIRKMSHEIVELRALAREVREMDRAILPDSVIEKLSALRAGDEGGKV